MIIKLKIIFIKNIYFLQNECLINTKILIIFNIILKTFKFWIFIFILLFIIIFNTSFFCELNNNYFMMQKDLNLTFQKPINKNINIGIYAYRIKDGGRARITSLLLNSLYKVKFFNIYLFTKINKEDEEYIFPILIKRKTINNNLIRTIKKYRIQILIYELENIDEINLLNNIKNIKVIFYLHTSSFDWIYDNFTMFKSLYRSFINSKYIISIVPIDNDYLFKKWGIRSIFMNNFITYDYNSIFSSELSSKIILMLGRGNAKKKRFSIGIISMEYIAEEIPLCELKIISNITRINKLQYLVDNLNLKNNINFLDYTSFPEIYFKNASLNIFPSISEAFPMVLSETKIYGLPSILLGLDYIAIAKGGTVYIYDDSPESLSKKAIILLKNDIYKKKLGLEARLSMKKFNNELVQSKWFKLILSVFNGDNYYQDLRKKDKSMDKIDLINIINNQINLLKKRELKFINITINNFENYTFLENLI